MHSVQCAGIGCDQHTMARIPSFAGDVPFMSMLFQACFTIIMVTLVYVLVSSDIVCEGYKSSYHTAVSCCCMCMGA